MAPTDERLRPRPLFRPLSSAHSTIAWPALPGPLVTEKLALLQQLEQSQWWTPQELFSQQLRQAGLLLQHAYRQVPFYRERLGEAGFVSGKGLTPAVWNRIPILTRAALQQAGPALYAAEPPRGHGATYEISGIR